MADKIDRYQLGGVVIRWLRHAKRSVLADDGWLLIGKALVVLGGFAGLFITMITYQTSVRATLLSNAYDRLEGYRARLQSENPAQRANGLNEIPALIALRAHGSSVSPIESAKILVGLGEDAECVLLQHTRAELYAYLHSYGANGLNRLESGSLFEALRSLGRDGWLSGELPDEPLSQIEGWSWIWQEPLDASPEPLRRLRLALLGIHLDGLTFEKTVLNGSEFMGARFHDVRFIRAELSRSRLEGTSFDSCVFDTATMNRTLLRGAHFANTDLRGCSITDSDLQETLFTDSILFNLNFSGTETIGERRVLRTTLSRAQFVDCIVSELDLSAVSLSGVAFLADNSSERPGATNSTFAAADLTSALLENCNFEGSDFARANLAGARASGSSFRFCTFANANLDGADMTNADLTGATGFAPTDNPLNQSVSSCTGLIINRAKGLSQDQIRHLVEAGAVYDTTDAHVRRPSDGR